MDVNRNEQESCQTLADDCNKAYKDYHSFIKTYFKSQYNASNPTLGYKQGLLIDIHGQAHPEERLEIGYYINSNDLNKPLLSDSLKNTVSKLRELNSNKYSVEELIRGASASLGGIIQNKFGYKACPSPTELPGTSLYFQGGFTVQTYSSYYPSSFNLNAIQIEFPKSMRNSSTYNTYAVNVASSIFDYYFIHSLDQLA